MSAICQAAVRVINWRHPHAIKHNELLFIDQRHREFCATTAAAANIGANSSLAELRWRISLNLHINCRCALTAYTLAALQLSLSALH